MATPEKIGPNCVVQFIYTLRDDDGKEIESNADGEPLSYLHGPGSIVEGLEKALDGKATGDSIKVSVSPEEGYGAHDDEKVFKVPKDKFDFDPEPGLVVQAQGPEGQAVPLQIIGVEDDEVELDGNHPLAGQTLNFEVEVKDVREATEQECAHGHSHDGGHHHH